MKYNYLYSKIYVISNEGQIVIFDYPAESNLIMEDEENVDH